MGRLYFDPRLVNPDGLYRRIYQWQLYDLLEEFVELKAACDHMAGRCPSWAQEAVRAAEKVLMSDGRPSDRYLLHPMHYTALPRWAELMEKGSWNFEHRIRVRASITTKGNLTVRFSPHYLDNTGRWVQAQEWINMDFLGIPAVAERPDDEILFVRDASDLLHERFHGEPKRDATRVLAARVVNGLFWLTVHRLASSYDVYLDNYTAALGHDENTAGLGLEIVDATQEYLESLEQFVRTFEVRERVAPSLIWTEYAAAQTSKRWRASEAVSKLLRDKSGPTAHLTPGVVEKLMRKLREAADWRAWQPPADAARTPEKGRESNVIPLRPSGRSSG